MKTHSSATPVPAQKASRLQVVDALRGAALFGILIAHCYRWFTVDTLPARLYQLHTTGPINRVFMDQVDLLLVDKFYTIFSFLFGLSFALMLSRSGESPAAFNRRFVRRLAVLAVIGLLHYLHWKGDILFVYAILGGFLLLARQFSTKWLLIAASVLALNIPAIVAHTCRALLAPAATITQHQPPSDELAVKQAQEDYHIVMHGQYTETLLNNASDWTSSMRVRLYNGRIYQTMGFFLLGLYAGRRRFFEQLARNRPLLWQLLGGSLLLVFVTSAVIALLSTTLHLEASAATLYEGLGRFVYTMRGVGLTGAYIAGLTLLFESELGRWATPALVPVGRMALTNYLLQTLFGSFLFFGYGLGLLATTQLWVATLLSLPIFLFQVWFSTYWLAHFRFGPVEWVWRSLTLGQLQPLRLSSVASKRQLAA